MLTDANAGSSPITAGATSFTLPNALNAGSDYAVSVQTQPTGQTCSVSNGSGTNITANVTTVAVTCKTTPTVSVTNTPQTFTGSPIAATVTCSSGGAVSNIKYNGSSTVPTNAGTYAITANCAANGNYTGRIWDFG